MSKNILITGATGLVGTKLITFLQSQGHNVAILSRRLNSGSNIKTFIWDVYKQQIDDNALAQVDTVIHLAGEGIADGKWTAKRKQQIIDSRVLSTQLLYQAIRRTKAPVTSFISASAVGFYGNRGEEVLTETSRSGDGFLADCCVAWENAVDAGIAMGIRVVKVRIGLVLDRVDGALAAMEKPVRYFVGAPLGSGKQWMPWIHLEDLVRIFSAAANDEQFQGAYNAAAPLPVTNATLTKSIGKQIGRPIWPVNVPGFLLSAILGEMSVLPLMSSNTSAQKLLDTGFNFVYTHLDEALTDIYHNPKSSAHGA